MKTQQLELPIPDLTAWMTRAAAAARLGVDASTVSRWAAAGVLTPRTPLLGPGDTRPAPLFYAGEVDDLAMARSKLGGRRARAA